MASQLHLDDALNYLIGVLAAMPEPKPGQHINHNDRPYGSDVWIAHVGGMYWQGQGVRVQDIPQNDADSYMRPFYDAAWELCRRGVLRPGHVVPLGRVAAGHFSGDGYAITSWGRQWLRKAVAERATMPSDPSRLAEVLLGFKKHFGDGYAQRAAEAVSDYRALNYLSACTMAGAAAESILLATAIAKVGDEGIVLAEYRSSGGRARVTKRLTSSVPQTIGERFAEGLGILSYWRDDAGHGTASTISEIEAHEALSRLLRLAQFTSDNWSKLTG